MFLGGERDVQGCLGKDRFRGDGKDRAGAMERAWHDALLPAQERRRRDTLLVPGRSDHREQPHGRPPRVGAHVQGRGSALPHDAGRGAAIPERLRLPGPVGGGGGREGAGAQVQARHREVRHREVCEPLQGARAQVRRRTDTAVGPPRLLDEVGQFLLHHVRGEQLHDLGLSKEVSRKWLDLQRPRRDALVPSLRHGNLAA